MATASDDILDEFDDADDGEGHILGKWHHVESAFTGPKEDSSLTSRKVRAAMSTTTSVLSTAVSVTGNAKHLALVGVGGAAVLGVGTAGIGLAVAGGVMSAIGMGTSGVSLYKTDKHIKNLNKIRKAQSGGRKCKPAGSTHSPDMGGDHSMIWTTILPYIVRQKKQKSGKKFVGTVGLSLATSVHRLGRAAYKKARGTKGKTRGFYAHVLARHCVTHDCWLAEEIISELFNPQDYLAIRQLDSETAGELIAGKMKSI